MRKMGRDKAEEVSRRWFVAQHKLILLTYKVISLGEVSQTRKAGEKSAHQAEAACPAEKRAGCKTGKGEGRGNT